MENPDRALKNAPESIVGVRIKSLRKIQKRENVYCLSAKNNRTMVANGIITRNCDALRYAIYSHFGKRTNLDYHKPHDDLGRGLGYNPDFHDFTGSGPF